MRRRETIEVPLLAPRHPALQRGGHVDATQLMEPRHPIEERTQPILYTLAQGRVGDVRPRRVRRIVTTQELDPSLPLTQLFRPRQGSYPRTADTFDERVEH